MMYLTIFIIRQARVDNHSRKFRFVLRTYITTVATNRGIEHGEVCPGKLKFLQPEKGELLERGELSHAH